MKPRGRHLLVEYTGCDTDVLDDPIRIEALMQQAARAAGARVVASVFRPFDPQGVTGVVVIEESHLSIHTWPEHGYAAVDFFTCGDCLPERAEETLAIGLRARCSEILDVVRGLGPDGGSIQVRSHRVARRGLAGTAPTARRRSRNESPDPAPATRRGTVRDSAS